MIYGDFATVEKIYSEFPLLHDKKHVIWEGDPVPVVVAMFQRLGRPPNTKSAWKPTISSATIATADFRLPKLRRHFTDLDKRRFLQDGFLVIREYFGHALDHLTKQEPRIHTELEDVTSQTIIARIFCDGNIVNECLIRVATMGLSAIIGYTEGRFVFYYSDKFNEILSVEDDGSELLVKFLIGSAAGYDKNRSITFAEAAQFLWKRFSERLESL